MLSFGAGLQYCAQMEPENIVWLSSSQHKKKLMMKIQEMQSSQDPRLTIMNSSGRREEFNMLRVCGFMSMNQNSTNLNAGKALLIVQGNPLFSY